MSLKDDSDRTVGFDELHDRMLAEREVWETYWREENIENPVFGFSRIRRWLSRMWSWHVVRRLWKLRNRTLPPEGEGKHDS